MSEVVGFDSDCHRNKRGTWRCGTLVHFGNNCDRRARPVSVLCGVHNTRVNTVPQDNRRCCLGVCLCGHLNVVHYQPSKCGHRLFFLTDLWLCCFCLPEPASGPDVLALQTLETIALPMTPCGSQTRMKAEVFTGTCARHAFMNRAFYQKSLADLSEQLP